MRRLLVTFAAVVFFVLTLGACVAMACSIWQPHFWIHDAVRVTPVFATAEARIFRGYYFASGRFGWGELLLERMFLEFPGSPAWFEDDIPDQSLLLSELKTAPPSPASWSIPLWPIAAIAGVIFVSIAAFPLAARFRSARRRAAGCCRNCGYDLRASPGRCPECGTEAAAV